MSDAEDIDLLAAEYALGTLPAAERAAVVLRARNEAALAAAIDAWERRLAPLAATIPERQPPPSLWPKISARIDALGDGNNVVGIERRLRRWRAAAIAATAIAASLLAFIGLREIPGQGQDKTFVAVLQKDAQSPAFLVSVDIETRQLTIRAVAAEPQPGKSYELWLVHDELKTPRSLGIVGDKPITVAPTLAAYKPEVIESGTLAVSLEPTGGSPTGAPTGPVLWSGKLIQATE
jgi:anti-sigma-K factor RskA